MNEKEGKKQTELKRKRVRIRKNERERVAIRKIEGENDSKSMNERASNIKTERKYFKRK